MIAASGSAFRDCILIVAGCPTGLGRYTGRSPMTAAARRALVASTMGLLLVAAAAVVPSATSQAASSPNGDRAYYILPPGNYGGLPTTANSTDQLPLYDALTPLRGNVTDADIAADYLPENFKPVGATHVESTGH